MTSQINRVYNVLVKNKNKLGITPAQLAKRAGISKDAVYKRVSDLRQEGGRPIYSNFRIVNGSRKMFYRAAQ